jgi:2-isopropylmalate synthase
LLRRKQTNYVAPFRLIDYHVMVGHREALGTFAEAMVKIAVGEKIMHTAAEGTGPVGALDEALRKALESFYPEVRAISLVDYKVRIVDERAGTAATIRVITECRKGATTWSTVGASSNVIEASWTALADAIEYGLMLPAESRA